MIADVFRNIESKYSFPFPKSYLGMYESGLFMRHGPNEIMLSDLIWLTPEEILNFIPLPYQIEGLIPFAKSARGDLFCWRIEPKSSHEAPVCFCPRDQKTATYFAGNFKGFVFRVMLEELSGTWLSEEHGVQKTADLLRRYVELVGNFLPESWNSILQSVSARPLRESEDGCFSMIDRRECDKLVRRVLDYPQLDTEFDHYV